MRLKIENFAKIKKADIELNGITVIGGDNNTGKSTVGKVLFCLHLAMQKVEQKVKNERIQEIAGICAEFMEEICAKECIKEFKEQISEKLSWMMAEEMCNKLKDVKKIDESGIYERLLDRWMFSDYSDYKFYLEYKKASKEQEILQPYVERIFSILNLSDEDIVKAYLSELFNDVFHGQINSLLEAGQDAVVQYIQNNREIKVSFRNNDCSEYLNSMPVFNKAVYISNPYIVDELLQDVSGNSMDCYLKGLLRNKVNVGKMDRIIDSVLAKEKLDSVYKTLSSVVAGNITEKQPNVYYLEDPDLSKPIRIDNLSTGLKSFVILKMLLEKGSLKEKDVLILDEPEIHMHPQWQLVYAELIVLLQKNFNLRILITTHSPYFLDAINLYSIKHGIDKKVNYYLASLEENQVLMKNVTDNIDELYKGMATPTNTLDTLRYELFNN